MIDDWFEALAALLDADARFLVVGAHALAVHGIPRGTQALDLWIDPTPRNAQRVWSGLAAFGAPLGELGIAVSDFQKPDTQKPDTVVQLGLPPRRIDVLTSISGVPDFAAAWSDRVVQPVRGREIPFIGREALIRNKRATGRTRDLADLEALGEAPGG